MDEIALAIHMEDGEHNDLNPNTICVECLKYQAIKAEQDRAYSTYRMESGE